MPGKQEKGLLPLCRRLTRRAAERVAKWMMFHKGLSIASSAVRFTNRVALGDLSETCYIKRDDCY